MGGYVFQSIHMDAIKIGHYAKNNAWSRIAHRGFYSCIHPTLLKNKVGIQDLELLYWFPTLTPKDEKRIHKLASAHSICGEWFTKEALMLLPTQENKAADCSKEEALLTRRRL